MPRRPRAVSVTGLYHIVIKATGKEFIFNTVKQKKFFMNLLTKIQLSFPIYVISYCVMDNHIHLLVYDQGQCLSDAVKRLSQIYSQYFNLDTDRFGHLYKNRFYSEPIDNLQSFLNVFRYIHNNPVCAGMVKEASLYRWSSFNSYFASSETIILPEVQSKVLTYFATLDAMKRFHSAFDSSIYHDTPDNLEKKYMEILDHVLAELPMFQDKRPDPDTPIELKDHLAITLLSIPGIPKTFIAEKCFLSVSHIYTLDRKVE